jgi:hypothetical protein
MWQLQLLTTVERPTADAHAATLLRAWFAGAFEAMGGQLREALVAGAPLSDWVLRKRPVNKPYGPPGTIWAHLMTGVRGPRGIRLTKRAFTTESWAAFLDGMAGVPHSTDLSLVTLGKDGYPGHPVFEVSARPLVDGSDRWLQLMVRFGPHLLTDPAYQRSVLTFAREFAGAWNPTYGEISYDRGIGRTAYENVFRGGPDETGAMSREVLRGYAWLTICPQEIGDRLGGVAALRASGVFAEVDELDRGGYWLLATGDYRDFGQEQAERIHPVLAPVLRPGEPLPDAPDDPPYYISRGKG